jgi:starch synthase
LYDYSMEKVTSVGTVFVENNTINKNKNIIDQIKNKRIIAVVGAIVPRKNIIEAINAFELLHRESIYLLIIGPKVDGFDDYYEEVKRKTVAPNIVFIENYTNIEWIYEYIDILLLTSKDEGIPRVILEALYYEKKIVSSDVGAIKNVFSKFTNTKQIMLYRLGDVKNLISALNYQLNNSKRYQSRDIVMDDFSITNHISKFIAIMKDL